MPQDGGEPEEPDDRQHRVICQYKMWSRHEYWLPTTGLPVIQLSDDLREPPLEVPRRLISTAPMRLNLERNRYRLHDHEYDEMVAMLDAIDQRQNSACSECKRLRALEQTLTVHKLHSKTEANAIKARRRQVRDSCFQTKFFATRTVHKCGIVMCRFKRNSKSTPVSASIADVSLSSTYTPSSLNQETSQAPVPTKAQERR